MAGCASSSLGCPHGREARAAEIGTWPIRSVAVPLRIYRRLAEATRSPEPTRAQYWLLAQGVVTAPHARLQGRFLGGTFERIEAVLQEGADRTDFVREAVERESEEASRHRRQGQEGRRTQPLSARACASVHRLMLCTVSPVRDSIASRNRTTWACSSNAAACSKRLAAVVARARESGASARWSPVDVSSVGCGAED